MADVKTPLRGIFVINTGLNLPAPRAAQMLQAQGAHIVKVEPPTGDTFEHFCKPWYEDLHRGVEVRRIDLKSEAGREAMAALLARAHILITSQRPSALTRMGLDPAILRHRYPRLAIVNIVGSPEAGAEVPGHDLTYQARAGLIAPPHLPRSLYADLAGAQQAVIAALALLHAGGGVQQVALSRSAELFHEPLAYGMTREGDFLGGAHAGYNIYETRDGYIALAALEHAFWLRLADRVLNLPKDPLAPEAHRILAEGFLRHDTADWVAWARAHDVPLEAI
ncbi:MAG TPA: CoA transferase [Caldilineae bacterium]|nr:CoA transferase [Caldilineae bacterium]HIQ11858.1 CoA transferase [Caldilineales bacterium]